MDARLNRIVAQEPMAVGQLFSLYGYDMPVTARNLQNLAIVHGAHPLPLSNFTTDTEAPKKSFAEILGMITSGATSVAKVIAAIKGKTPIAEGNGIRAGIDPTTGATERVFGIDRKLFLVLAALVMLMVVALIFRKK